MRLKVARMPACRAARIWCATGSRWATQLRAHLLCAFPAAAGLFCKLHSAISLAFLARFDCQDRADWLSGKRLAAWLKAASYSGRTGPADLYQRLMSAPRGATGEAGAASAQVTRALAAVLASLNTQIKALDAQIAAHNMLCAERERRPHVGVPSFWSIQFGVNIKSVGVPSVADHVVVAQGSTEQRRFAAAYGRQGQLVGAATFNGARWLEHYERLIASTAPFPPDLGEAEQATGATPVPADFPAPHPMTNQPTVLITGHSPTDLHVQRTLGAHARECDEPYPNSDTHVVTEGIEQPKRADQ